MRYDNYAASRWAAHHALVRQPFAHSCAVLVGRSLWAGGLTPTKEWNEWSGSKTGPYVGTPAFLRADSLVRHLVGKRFASLVVVYNEAKGIEPVKIPRARVGDVLAFDWYGEYGDGRWSHVSVVTKMCGGIPYVSEWGTAEYHGLICPYRRRRWDWSCIKHTPLRENHASLRVGLLMVGR